jgi:hypothetical protein
MQHGHMKFTFIPILSTYAATTQAKADLIRKGSSSRRWEREKRNDNNNDQLTMTHLVHYFYCEGTTAALNYTYFRVVVGQDKINSNVRAVFNIITSKGKQLL